MIQCTAFQEMHHLFFTHIPRGNGDREDAKGILLGFLLAEHDFVDDEENHHGNVAIEDGSADVIQPGGHEVTG